MTAALPLFNALASNAAPQLSGATLGAITFEPSAPFWLIASFAVIGGLIAVFHLWRSPAGGLMRMIALAGVLALLANPQIRMAETTPLDDLALIFVDKSASQTFDGRTAASEQAATALTERLTGLGAMAVERIDVDGEEETLIGASLTRALADRPRARLSGVFVITDGRIHDADKTAQALKAATDAPVHLMSTGRDGEFDRKISLIKAPRYGIVRQNASISFRIDDVTSNDQAAARSQTANVTLRINGEARFTQAVPIGVEAAFDAPLDRPGPLVIELEVDSYPGELTARNNIAVLPITAIRDRLRVLLISGEPHTGERVWRNLLKSDPAIDLVHFTILRPFEKNDGALENELALIPFPRDELFIEKLTEFDLLIFDRYTYRGVLNAYHFDNIARYVERGGAVLIASGPEFTGAASLAARRNLSFILPALPSGGAQNGAFRPSVSEDGARHPVTADLPEQSFWGRWLRIMPVQQRSGRTLMEGPDGAPLLILDRVSEGRVGLLLSDHVWLWARGFDGGGPHAELLRRIAHWLMKEPELEEERLTLTGAGERLLIERRSLEAAAPAVALTMPGGEVREIELVEAAPGLFTAALEGAPRGLYRARSGDLFAVGAVGLAAAPEFINVVSSLEAAAPLAAASNGGMFELRDASGLSAARGGGVKLPALRRVRENAPTRAGPGWAGLIDRRAERIDAVSTAPLAPPWAWLGLITLALAAAWVLESGRFRIRN